MPAIGSTYHRLAAWMAGLCVAGATLPATSGAASEPVLVIRGAGFGHGVGMSQEGALGYAEHGFSYRAILAHYYSGTSIGTAPAGSRVRVLISGHVQTLPLETYVRGVVSAEMPASWPLAALEAQAVASRTYALTAHAGGSRFDVYADSRSQVYRGAAAYTAQTDAAVAATAGQIVTYAGRPAITYFFASSGGRTEDVQYGFPGALPEPWLRSVADPYESGPLHSWTMTIPFSAVAARLGDLVHGSFRGIEVVSRGVSPRIVSAYVLGSAGRTLVSGPELEARLGLYDTWAYFSVRSGVSLSPEPDSSGPTVAVPPEAPTSLPAATTGAVGVTGAGATGAGASGEAIALARAGGVTAPA